MVETKKRKWLGGYVREGSRGSTFVIERWVNGTHWHVSTKCRTERAALKELEKFEADPLNYRVLRARKTVGVILTPELINDYLEHMARRQLDPPYINQAETNLGNAMVALKGRDLSRMTLVELRDLLDAVGDPTLPAARAARRKHMKSFGKWLRVEKGLLTRTNDPTLDLVIEHAAPEKHRRRKAMSVDLVERAIRAMDPDVADVAIVLAGTGMHIREVMRLHAGIGGLHEPLPWQKEAGVLLNISVRHKSKQMHAVAITDANVAAAARRIVARKDFPSRGRITKHDENVSKAIGEKFSMGWLRHSVATWMAVNHSTLQDIADQLGHVDTRMARSTYIDMGIASHPKPIPKLKLVKS